MFYCSILEQWNITALVNTYTHVYFNNFINSFSFLGTNLYYLTCSHLPTFSGTFLSPVQQYTFQLTSNTHFYISFNNIIIIVFVYEISPKSNSFCLPMYYYKVIIFQNNIYYVLTVVTPCRPPTQTYLYSIPPMAHSKHFLFLSQAIALGHFYRTHNIHSGILTYI